MQCHLVQPTASRMKFAAPCGSRMKMASRNSRGPALHEFLTAIVIGMIPSILTKPRNCSHWRVDSIQSTLWSVCCMHGCMHAYIFPVKAPQLPPSEGGLNSVHPLARLLHAWILPVSQAPLQGSRLLSRSPVLCLGKLQNGSLFSPLRRSQAGHRQPPLGTRGVP